MRLYLLRHGQPDIAPGICYGGTDLAVPPHEHARVLSAALPLLPRQVPLYASPLRRCRELAVQLAAALQAPTLIHDERLAEMHFGAWEMRAWDDIPRSEIDAWANDLSAYRPGGGENVIEVATRVRAFHTSLCDEDIDCAVVVCHAGTMRLLAQCGGEASIAAMAQNAAQEGHRFAYGEVLMLDC